MRKRELEPKHWHPLLLRHWEIPAEMDSRSQGEWSCSRWPRCLKRSMWPSGLNQTSSNTNSDWMPHARYCMCLQLFAVLIATLWQSRDAVLQLADGHGTWRTKTANESNMKQLAHISLLNTVLKEWMETKTITKEHYTTHWKPRQCSQHSSAVSMHTMICRTHEIPLMGNALNRNTPAS